MVPILVLLMIVACLGIEAMRNRKAKLSAASEKAREGVEVPRPSLQRLYHAGHTWAQIEDAQTVLVGIDDFAQRFMGHLDAIAVRTSGMVHQGEALATLRHKNRELAVVAPVSGVLVGANQGIADDPGAVNASPYERGWLARIRPSRLETEIRNLLTGAAAERWQEGLQSQMASWFAPRLGMVLQDGGEWVDNLSDLLTDDQWHELARKLFPVLPPDQFNDKPVKG